MSGDQPTTGRVAMRGGLSTTVARLAVVFIGLAGTAVLARLLTPADFGLVAKVTALTGIVNLLGEVGISIAVVQASELNGRQIAAFFWWNALVSVGLGTILILVSPLIAAFYRDSRVVSITMIIATAITIRGIGVVPMAVLRRNCQFTTMAAVQISAATVAVPTAIVLSQRVGFYSLAIQIAAMAMTTTILAIACTGGLPKLLLRGTGIGDQFKLGLNFTAQGLINYFARNSDNILIGRYVGETALANYSKAYGLLMLPLSQIAGPLSQVAVPILSRLQDRPTEYRRQFLVGSSLSFLVQLPAAILVTCTARPLVLTLLGGQWESAIPIFYALAPAVVVSTTAPGTYWIIPSLGLAKRQLPIVIVNTIVVVIAIAIGLQYGVLGVAVGFTLASTLLRYPSLRYAMKPSSVATGEFLMTGLTPLLASLASAIGMWALVWLWEPAMAPLALIYRIILFTAFYAALVWPTTAGRRLVMLMKQHLLPFCTII